MGILKKIGNFFLKFYNLKIDPVVVDHDKFLGNEKNSLEIYTENKQKTLICPFNFSFIHLERLMLINIENDPIFDGFELQVMDVDNKKQPVLILFKKQESQEVYYTSELTKERHKEVTEKLLSNPSFYVVPNIDYLFEFDENGLKVQLLFQDSNNHKIDILVRENTPGRELSSMLAPIGASTPDPKYFPYIYLKKFGMVLKENTNISVKIDGNKKKVLELPVKANGKPSYLARFSLDPVLGFWNNSFEGNISILKLNEEDKIQKGNMIIHLINNNGFYEINRIVGRDLNNHEISFDFSPPIPNLFALKSNKQIRGKFSSGIGDLCGIFSGYYQVKRQRNNIFFHILPQKAWQPFPGKSWVKYYEWKGKIEIHNSNEIFLESKWQNNKVMSSEEFTEKTSK